MKIESLAFENNQRMPSKYTCDGEDVSPPLVISEIPENAKTICLIVDDPDAPTKTWVHWVVFNIPVSGNILKIGEGEKIGVGGINDFQKLDYGGPCPPSGTHRYFFKAYALDCDLDLQEGATKDEVEKAMEGHVIESAELVGLYSRGY